MGHEKPRLLIIGAGGFLGQHLARRAASSFEVFEADLKPLPGGRGLTIDTTSAASVSAAFRETKPHAVVLLAAISDIDECERRPDIAEAVNVRGTAHVAEECALSSARLVFTSSAAVFDGTKRGYLETDPPTAVSVYGKTKVRGEQLVVRTLPNAVILRLALVIGLADGGGTNAMLNKFREKLRAGEPVSVPDFEYRNPIDAGTLSNFVLDLLAVDSAAGVFHLGARESISRFELAVRLAGRMGFSNALIQRQTQPLAGRAPRGLDHFLVTAKIEGLCRTPVPSVDEVIERAIHGSPQSNS